jgi:hypothetical protein
MDCMHHPQSKDAGCDVKSHYWHAHSVRACAVQQIRGHMELYVGTVGIGSWVYLGARLVELSVLRSGSKQ